MTKSFSNDVEPTAPGLRLAKPEDASTACQHIGIRCAVDQAVLERMLQIEPELAGIDDAGKALRAVASLARNGPAGQYLQHLEGQDLAALIQLLADTVACRLSRVDDAMRPAFSPN